MVGSDTQKFRILTDRCFSKKILLNEQQEIFGDADACFNCVVRL